MMKITIAALIAFATLAAANKGQYTAEIEQCLGQLSGNYSNYKTCPDGDEFSLDSRCIPAPVAKFADDIKAIVGERGLFLASDIDSPQFEIWASSVQRPTECDLYGALLSERLEADACFDIEKYLNSDYWEPFQEAIASDQAVDLIIGAAVCCANSRPAYGEDNEELPIVDPALEASEE